MDNQRALWYFRRKQSMHQKLDKLEKAQKDWWIRKEEMEQQRWELQDILSELDDAFVWKGIVLVDDGWDKTRDMKIRALADDIPREGRIWKNAHTGRTWCAELVAHGLPDIEYDSSYYSKEKLYLGKNFRTKKELWKWVCNYVALGKIPKYVIEHFYENDVERLLIKSLDKAQYLRYKIEKAGIHRTT